MSWGRVLSLARRRKRFADIPGHEDVKERLRDMALSGRIPHALLLEGPSKIFRVQGNGAGYGHAFLHTARYFSRVLVFGSFEVYTLYAEQCTVAHLAASHIGKHHQGEHHIAEHGFAPLSTPTI